MEETWMYIPNYENLYKISNFGRIMGKKKVFLKGNVGTTGYIHVNLFKEGKYKTIDIHRMVSIVFIPNPRNVKYVNHIDGNKLNNYVTNLEWVTARENTNHATLVGLKNDSGSKSSNSKLKENEVIEIRRLSKIMTNKELGDLYKVSSQYIPLLIHNRRWSHLE